MRIYQNSTFLTLRQAIARDLLSADFTDVGEWQSLDVSNSPAHRTKEIQRAIISIYPHPTIEGLQKQLEPNLPWAEAHFLERVCGVPLNPGEQYKNWPWYKGNVPMHQTQQNQQFSHSYMERYWPRMANVGETRPNGRQVFVPHNGIRFEYGDLDDVVVLLQKNPHTRQAYLPVWFPEDTGGHERLGERVPCTLGYQFLIRNDTLSCDYFMRSCDFIRHFSDDLYLTARLMHYILERINEHGSYRLGALTSHITSLHCFAGDMAKLQGYAT